ncbi:hypothetical protein E2C01_058777 [Portunus trituberculatus]|uniref:Uncharacterized protein n=1 Tax=Portunus trituberculatus TaxID=210409 RepID=A0A5B7H3Z3_PORTR|nr:hypothetical protein [Portunus trituberculatus]
MASSPGIEGHPNSELKENIKALFSIDCPAVNIKSGPASTGPASQPGLGVITGLSKAASLIATLRLPPPSPSSWKDCPRRPLPVIQLPLVNQSERKKEVSFVWTAREGHRDLEKRSVIGQRVLRVWERY